MVAGLRQPLAHGVGDDTRRLRELLQQVQVGACSIDDALVALQHPSTPPAKVGGLEPDVPIVVDPAERKKVLATLGNHEPPAKHLAAFTAVAAKYGFPVPAPPHAATDPQLAQALATLRERIAAAAATVPEPR